MAEIASLGLKVEGVQNIARATNELGKLAQSSEAAEKSTEGLSSGSRRAADSVKRAGEASARSTRELSNLANAARTVGGALAAIGVTASLASAVRQISEFQSALNGLAAVSGATATQMGQLEKQARSLGATSQFSAQQAAEGQRFLAQAGFDVNEILAATPGILQLATAGSLDLATAADIASNVLGGMRLEVDQLNRVNDVLAATAARSNTSIEQLGQALSFAAPFAASVGISIEEASAAIGNMSDAGIQASRAGTGLVGVIRQLSNVTGGGNDVLQRYGLSLGDIDIASRGLQPVLETLREASLTTGDAIALFGSEAGAAAQILINDYKGAIRDAEGESARMAGILDQGLGPAFRSLASAAAESVQQLGDDSGLAAALENLVRNVTGVISVWNGMGEAWADSNKNVNQETLRSIELIANATEILAVAVGARLVTALASAALAQGSKTKSSIAGAKAEAEAATAVTRRTGAELLAQKRLYARALAEEQATRGTAAHSAALANLNAQRQAGIQAATAHKLATNNAADAMTRASASAQALAAAGRAASGALALVGGPLGAAVLAGAAAYYFRDALGFASAAARETKQEIDQLVGSIEGLTRVQYQNQYRELTDNAADARFEVEKLQKQIESLQERANQDSIVNQGRGGAASSQIVRLQAELQEQLRVLEAAEEGVARYSKSWEDFQKSQITGASIFRTLDQWLFDTGESAERTSRQFNALHYTLGTGGDDYDDYIGKLRSARDVLGLTADEAARYAAEQQGYTGIFADQAAAVAGQTDALEDYASAIAAGNQEEAQTHLDRARRFAEAEAMVQAQLLNMETLTRLLQGVQTELSSVALTAALTVADAGGAGAAYLANAINAINDRAAAIQRTTVVTERNTAANREAKQAERELAEAERERQRALDDSVSAYRDLFRAISPAGAAQADYNATVARLTIAYEAGTKSALEYYAAIGQAAKIYNDALRAADPNIQRVKQLTQEYDRAYIRGQELARALADINQAWRDDPANGEQYARIVAGIRTEMDELALAADPAAQEMARAWEEASDRIDKTFADAFNGAFDSFGSFSKQLMDGFKRLLAELAYQAALKPIVLGFTQDIRGLLSGAAGGFGNTISAASSLYGSGSKLLAGGTAAGGLYGSAATASAGTLYGSAATGAAIGPAASAGIASGVSAGITAAMPWIAGGLAIDTLLGGSITNAIGSLFGGGKSNPRLNISTRGDAGQFNHESVRSGAFGAVGFSEGTRRSNDLFGGVDAEREWLASVAAMDDLLASVARTPEQLDAMAEAVRHVVITASDAASANDMLASRTLAAVGAIDGELAASLRSLGLSAEEITGRIVSAAESMQIISAASGRLNLQYDAGAQGALRLADSLTQYVGSIENLNNIQQAYYQAAFSDNERLQHSLEDVRGSLNSLSSANITSVEHLRQLVEAQNLNSEAGQRLAYDLMALAPALRQSNEAVREAISQQYESALGREADADGLAYWFSQVTNGALTLQGALDNIAAASSNAADAADDASSAIDNTAQIMRERETLERQLLTLQGNTAELRRRDLAATHESNRALQQRIWYTNDANSIAEEANRLQNQRNQAIERESNAMAQARQQLASFGASINDWLNNLRGTEAGLGTPADMLAATSQAFEEQYAKALEGDQSALNSITQYADRFIDAQKSWSASGDQTVNTIDRVSELLAKLPDQLSAEQFLAKEFRSALGQQTSDLLAGQEIITDRLSRDFDSIDLSGEGLIDWTEFRTAFAGVASDETLRKIFGALDNNGSGAIDKLEVISGGTMSLVDYWRNQQSSGVQSAIDQISDVYQDALKREPDLPGLQYWIDQFLAGASLRTIEQSIRQHVGSSAGANGGSSAGGSSSSTGGSSTPKPVTKTPRPFWERALDANWSDIQRTVVESYQRSNQRSAAIAYADSRNVKIPAYASGAFNLPGDHLAKVHANEFIAPAQGGIADEFRAYAAGNYQAELMSELNALRNDFFPLLNHSDVTQVMRDMQRTIQAQGDKIAELLRQGNKTAEQNRDVNAAVGADAKRDRSAQLKESQRQTRIITLEKETAF